MAAPSAAKRILAQVEFYLSDRNLAKDDFFRELVTKEDGWVDFATLLNCNRIKVVTSSADDVKAAVAGSKVLEVNAAGDKVRRTKPYTPGSGDITIDADRCILSIEGLAKGTRWNVVKDAIEAVANVAFVKVTDVKGGGNAAGHAKKRRRDEEEGAAAAAAGPAAASAMVAVNLAGKPPADVVADVNAADIVLLGKKVVATLVEGDAAKTFWAEQTSKEGKKSDAPKAAAASKGAKAAAPKPAEKEYTLPSKTYKGFDAVAEHFRGIIKGATAGELLSGLDADDVKTVLCHHPTAADKLEDAVGFTVGKHPTFPETTCLMIQKKDGSTVDFSWKKCVEAWSGAPKVDPSSVTFASGSKKAATGGAGSDE